MCINRNYPRAESLTASPRLPRRLLCFGLARLEAGRSVQRPLSACDPVP
jgi:hypothetical protein